MVVQKIILVWLFCLIAISCSSNLQTTSCQKATLDNVANLGSLQTRNGIIRLELDGKFSILDLSGNPIALFLNEAEFQKDYPRLYKDFETAIANIESGDIILDASMGADHTQLKLLH